MKHLPLNNDSYKTLHKEFGNMILIKNYSRGLNTMYASCVREFLFFIENRNINEITEIKATNVIDYYEYIRERPNQRREGGLSESMIRHHLFSLRLFFDYLIDTKVIEASPVHLPKFTVGKYKERQILTEEEIKQVYGACENKRDKALISIAYGCGLRRTEIEKLNINDVNFFKGTLIVRDGKGGKSRTVPLSDSVIEYLREYIIYEREKNRTGQNTPAFFLNNNGTRASGDFLNRQLKIILKQTKNNAIQKKEITLHCLRHSIATHLLDHGATMEFVQQFLGHSEIDTAMLYSKRRKQRQKIQQFRK